MSRRGPADSPEYDATPEQPLLRQVPGMGTRKKTAGVRQWLVVDTAGESQVVEAGKHAIMRRTGLSARDLRILDPLLSYPSTVLGRESAIVINLEHVKAIITAQEVLLLNFKDPSVIPFVEEIKTRILRHHHAITSQETGNSDCRNLHSYGVSESIPGSPESYCNSFLSAEDLEKKQETGDFMNKEHGPKLLPFEFVTLEACLEAACGCLETEARTLELEAHSALDKLTTEISTLNLECVRQIKSRLAAIIGRVQKVRDELEHLLDDDQDMAEMYLTEKLQEQHENSPISSVTNEDEDLDDADIAERAGAELLSEPNGNIREGQVLGVSTAFSRGSQRTLNTMHSAISMRYNVEELEMLLEAYFIQIEGIVNKLSTLKEYVDDTEDYINIMLDDKQNQLLQMGILLTTATFMLSIFIVVSAIMGMNIRIPVFNDTANGNRNFALLCVITFGFCLVLYILAVSWCRRRGLLE